MDINSNQLLHNELTISATTFMDDNTLTANSINNLKKMIIICHEFFHINDIQANINKYEVLKINSQEESLSIDM